MVRRSCVTWCICLAIGHLTIPLGRLSKQIDRLLEGYCFQILFLVLHYLTTDSAREWDVFLDSCLTLCTWVRAGSRRALALHMYDKCHIAPSHRRFAHPSWIAGMKLMLDLYSVPVNTGIWADAWLIPDLLKFM